MASSDLVKKTVSERLRGAVGAQDLKFVEAKTQGNSLADYSTKAAPPREHKQTALDKPIVEKISNTVLNKVSGKAKARFLAVSALVSGNFLLAFPNSSFFTRLNLQTILIGVALCLADPILTKHRCICGRASVHQFELHGFVRHTSEGKHARHEYVNDIK